MAVVFRLLPSFFPEHHHHQTKHLTITTPAFSATKPTFVSKQPSRVKHPEPNSRCLLPPTAATTASTPSGSRRRARRTAACAAAAGASGRRARARRGRSAAGAAAPRSASTSARGAWPSARSADRFHAHDNTRKMGEKGVTGASPLAGALDNARCWAAGLGLRGRRETA